MRAFSFTLLAVLSSIAVVGAIPIGDNVPSGGIARRQLYVSTTAFTACGYSDQTKKLSQAVQVPPCPSRPGLLYPRPPIPPALPSLAVVVLVKVLRHFRQ